MILKSENAQQMVTKNVDEYLKLPYTIEAIYDEGEGFAGWFARVAELPGCMTQASSFKELGEMIHDAMRAWIEVSLEDGVEIPLPRQREEYSGKFVVRVPKSLHRQLVEEAERQGVSLNAYVNVALAKSVGVQTVERPTPDYYPYNVVATTQRLADKPEKPET
jgi:antitoxin HicB